MEEITMSENAVHPFDARGVAKRFRHAAIFGALESLDDGEVMRFVNDHDPLPLLGQIQQRYGNQVAINYVAREPGNIVIDFMIQLGAPAAVGAPAAAAAATGGCSLVLARETIESLTGTLQVPTLRLNAFSMAPPFEQSFPVSALPPTVEFVT